LIVRRSQLEMRIDILKALARHGPLKITHIMQIKEQTLPKKRDKTRVVYAITEGGKTAIRYFRELNIVLQITEEANKPSLLY